MANKLRIQTHEWFNTLIKCTVGLFLRGKYDLHAENADILSEIKPPYILLPTHANLWDPFFLNYYVHHPIFFVTSDALFRNRFSSYWLRQFGCIPKSQAIPDIETIRNIMAVIKRGDVLCIYPEGMQTWDGTTLPLNPNTARLLKLLKVPVIRVISHGAFSTCPRWSKNRRQGRVTLDFKKILTAEDIRTSPVGEIDRVIQKELSYNEWDWLAASHRYFNNFFGALGMEKVLYGCPACGSSGSMRSALNIVRCAKCGFIARFNNKGRFVNHLLAGVPENLHEWNKIQKEHLRLHIGKALHSADSIMRNNVLAFTGYRINPMKKYATGVLSLHADRLVFEPDAQGFREFAFPIDRIEGLAFLRRHIEFYVDRTLYRFRFLSKYGSSLKWNDAIGILKDDHLNETRTPKEQGQSTITAF
jgi:1-acyl-sn-glycerol-3-phosphate acyltransferase